MLPFFLLVIILFTWPSFAMGATYYVAQTGGNNGHTCTQAQSQSTPKQTIAAGLGCLAPSDTLFIKGGTYVEPIQRNTIPSGTASANTIVSGFSNDVVILRPAAPGGAAGDAVWIGGSRAHITIRKIVIDAANVTAAAIRFNEAAHHITIEDLEVKNTTNSSACITMSGTNSRLVNHVTMRRLHVHHRRAGGLGAHGIYPGGSFHVIEDSEVHDNNAYGIHQYGGLVNTGHTIRNNRIHDNGGWGILMGSGDDNIAYNNMVWNNLGGITIYSGNPINNQIYNNTVYKNNQYCIWVRKGTNAVVKNNICWRNASGDIPRNEAEASGTLMSNNLTADPKFSNLANLDFRLTEGSPTIDAGASILIVKDDFYKALRSQTLPYDIGAHEFSQQNPPPDIPRGLAVN